MFSTALDQYRNTSKSFTFVNIQKVITGVRISGLMEEVARIQLSLGWAEKHFQTTQTLMADHTVTKFLLHDQDTHELLGYALAVPQVQNVWKLTQYAIDQAHFGKNNYDFMMRILEEARKSQVTIRIEADPLSSFYFQFNKRSTSTGYQVHYDHGIYRFENRIEATERLIKEIDEKYPKDEKRYEHLKYLFYSYPEDLDYERFYQSMIQRPHFEPIFDELCTTATGGIYKFLDFIRETTDQNIKVTCAKAFARGQSGVLIEELHHLSIKSEEDRIELLKLCLTKDFFLTKLFYKNFKYYGISSPQVMIELIKMSVGDCPSDSVKEFHHLEFPNEQIRDDLINELYQQYLKKRGYHFEVDTPLAAQLEEIAKKDRNEVSGWIRYAKITDQEALFRIAANTLKGPSWAFSEFEKFGIEDEDKRIELFKMSIEINSIAANYFEKFNIRNENNRILLAKWLIQNHYYFDLAKNIHKFEISREEDRLELAKLEAGKPSRFSGYIDNCRITSEEDRKELAWMALKNSPQDLMRNFKKYQISKESDRIEFAELCLKQINPGYDSDFASYIGQFEISDEQVRIKLALEAASRGLVGDTNSIMSYKISSEDVIFEMAKLAAFVRPETVAKTVYRYRIRDEKRRIELAKIIASKKDGNISEHIIKFCIQDQEELKKIAILDTTLNPKSTSRNIKKYGLIQEKDRIQVALAAGAECAPHLDLFEITDKQIHLRLASAAALSEEPNLLLQNLDKFKLDDESWFEVGKLVARHQGKGLHYLLRWTYFSEMSTMTLLWSAIKNTIHYNIAYANRDYFCSGLPPSLKLYTLFFSEHADLKHLKELENECPKSLFTYVEEAPGEEEKLSMAKWVVYILGTKLIYNLSEEEFQEVLRNPCIKEIAIQTYERLRYKLVDLLVQTKSSVPPESLATLVVKGFYEIAPHKIYNDPKNVLTFTGGLYQILYDTNMTQDQRKFLMDHVFSSNKPLEVLKMMRIVQSILLLGGESELKKETYDLNAILLDFFKKKIPIGNMENFGDKFQKTFGSFCDPNLLFIYGAKVKNVSDERLMKAFILFVETVLNGTFLEQRYKNSLHLDTVFKEREATLVEWKKGLKREWDQKDCCDDEMTFSFYDILKDKIKEQGHIDHADCAELLEYFIEPKGVLRKIGEKLKAKRKNKAERTKNDDLENREINKLYLQRHCIRLMNPKLKPFEQKIELAQIKAYAGNIFEKGHLFLNDIEGFERPFIKIENNYDGWTVEDTDNPESLFTCGSVDPGCCQRIDGNIAYNKCLLGYVLEGKNRLLCVRNKNGRMIARAIFRILWDKENQTPVLFVEPIYPSIVKPSIKKAIVRLAKDRAKELGLPFAQDDDLELTYKGTLVSLSSKAPYEYTDKGGGQTQGQYYIRGIK